MSETQMRAAADCLGQCGTSFKGSALTIQSLHIKFYTLGKGSLPKPAPPASDARSAQDAGTFPGKQGYRGAAGARLPRTPGVPELGAVPRVLWRQLLPTGCLIPMLQCSQKDLDATVAAAQKGHLLAKNRC